MAKVILEGGIAVDALVLIKSNLNDYMKVARKLMSEARESGTDEHISALLTLENCLYFLQATVKDLPIRKYKQKGGKL